MPDPPPPRAIPEEWSVCWSMSIMMVMCAIILLGGGEWSVVVVCCEWSTMDYGMKSSTTNRSDSIQIDPIHYKSIRFETNRSDSIQIDPIHNKSIRFIQIDPIHTNRSEPTLLHTSNRSTITYLCTIFHYHDHGVVVLLRQAHGLLPPLGATIHSSIARVLFDGRPPGFCLEEAANSR